MSDAAFQEAQTAQASGVPNVPAWSPDDVGSCIIAMSGAPRRRTPGSAGIGEIIVTATKREERLQDVPVAIQAFSTEKLEELRVTKFDDYVKFLPNVSYQEAGPGFARIFMRGVSSGDNGNHSGPLPSVGMYLDEQPITTIQGPLDIHIYDIARVETLAGPQGTLYGASSQAGTIRIITNKPELGAFSASYRRRRQHRQPKVIRAVRSRATSTSRSPTTWRFVSWAGTSTMRAISTTWRGRGRTRR